jgi:hypothetical protein
VIRHPDFASCYAYSPTGIGGVCEHFRLRRSLLKDGDEKFIQKYALLVHEQVDRRLLVLLGFFGAHDILVPVRGN